MPVHQGFEEKIPLPKNTLFPYLGKEQRLKYMRAFVVYFMCLVEFNILYPKKTRLDAPAKFFR
jgi:hypothetical protein